MTTPKKTYRLPDVTVGQLDAMAFRDSPGRPNATATLCRIIATAYRAEGEPPVPSPAETAPTRRPPPEPEPAAPPPPPAPPLAEPIGRQRTREPQPDICHDCGRPAQPHLSTATRYGCGKHYWPRGAS